MHAYCPKCGIHVHHASPTCKGHGAVAHVERLDGRPIERGPDGLVHGDIVTLPANTPPLEVPGPDDLSITGTSTAGDAPGTPSQPPTT